MQASQIMSELHSLLLPTIYRDSTNNISPTGTHHHDSQNNPLYQLYNNISPHQGQEVSTKWTCMSSNSTTSDDADEQQMSVIIHDRKQRRMISNRESARRSRMRKQRHLDELWSQVVWLRNENQQLMEKLNEASENHHRLVDENSQLKEEVSELKTMLINIDHYSITTLSNLP